MQARRVLIVEDDPRLRGAIVRGLADPAFQVVAVGDGASALLAASPPAAAFDVIILDIGLPDSDGRDVCQALRSRGVTAMVLFLTAREQVTDQLSGFAAGGDDYLTKPFPFSVLSARVSALARRAEPSVIGQLEPDHSQFHLDPGVHAAVAGTISVDLTPTEFRIIGALISAADRVVRRRELLAAAWPLGAVVHDNTLDQYIARIRRKLKKFADPPRIVTVHGVGYRLSPPALSSPGP